MNRFIILTLVTVTLANCRNPETAESELMDALLSGTNTTISIETVRVLAPQGTEWQTGTLRIVTEPMDFSKCVYDVYLAVEIWNSFGIQVFDPEVQLLAVIGG